jgi:hypothetical protein
VIHIYEVDWGAEPFYWEVYGQALESDTDSLNYARTLEDDNELELYLDILRAKGVDFVLHTQEEYDEYHVALPSV